MTPQPRPDWIAPGLVLCERCFATDDMRWADDHWPKLDGEGWVCDRCEPEGD